MEEIAKKISENPQFILYVCEFCGRTVKNGLCSTCSPNLNCTHTINEEFVNFIMKPVFSNDKKVMEMLKEGEKGWWRT